mgnify:CR=1 FL=1
MRFRTVRVVFACAIALSLPACGGDEEDEGESVACAALLDALQACITDWCDDSGFGNPYCTCFEDGAILEVPPGAACRCGGSGSWRDVHQAVYCSEDLPENAADFLDCPGTTAAIAGETGRCG